jgi:hypothetical protein
VRPQFRDKNSPPRREMRSLKFNLQAIIEREGKKGDPFLIISVNGIIFKAVSCFPKIEYNVLQVKTILIIDMTTIDKIIEHQSYRLGDIFDNATELYFVDEDSYVRKKSNREIIGEFFYTDKGRNLCYKEI